jgi:hypothetical protein
MAPNPNPLGVNAAPQSGDLFVQLFDVIDDTEDIPNSPLDLCRVIKYSRKTSAGADPSKPSIAQPCSASSETIGVRRMH